MSNWISLKDRMPDDGFDVMLTDGKDISVGFAVIDELIPSNVNSYDEVEFTFEPTHWQPLPSIDL